MRGESATEAVLAATETAIGPFWEGYREGLKMVAKLQRAGRPHSIFSEIAGRERAKHDEIDADRFASRADRVAASKHLGRYCALLFGAATCAASETRPAVVPNGVWS